MLLMPPTCLCRKSGEKFLFVKNMSIWEDQLLHFLGLKRTWQIILPRQTDKESSYPLISALLVTFASFSQCDNEVSNCGLLLCLVKQLHYLVVLQEISPILVCCVCISSEGVSATLTGFHPYHSRVRGPCGCVTVLSHEPLCSFTLQRAVHQQYFTWTMEMTSSHLKPGYTAAIILLHLHIKQQS